VVLPALFAVPQAGGLARRQLSVLGPLPMRFCWFGPVPHNPQRARPTTTPIGNRYREYTTEPRVASVDLVDARMAGIDPARAGTVAGLGLNSGRSHNHQTTSGQGQPGICDFVVRPE
jgi:hypothetical protein